MSIPMNYNGNHAYASQMQGPGLMMGQMSMMMGMMMSMMQSMFCGGFAGMPMMSPGAMPFMNGLTGGGGLSQGYSPFPSFPQGGPSYNPSSGSRQTHGAGGFSQGPRTQYDDIINAASQRHGVDPALIKAVIKQESGFRNHRTSSAGAAGLMQLMPATARELGVQNVMDPAQNIEGGTKYLARMLRRYNGNVRLALAAYNAGPGNVRKHGGVPPFRETQNYVRRITADYARTRNA